MIVVAIIGILAALAIPNYIHYTMRARQAEAMTMLGSVRARQMSFYSTWDCFISAAPNPPVFPSGSGANWLVAPPTAGNPCQVGGHTFTDLDMRPNSTLLHFQYACAINGTRTEYSCNARGDLDSDGVIFEMLMCTDNAGGGLAPASPVAGSACGFPFEIHRASIGRY